ncbi:11108_t:CDS:2 [Cetraspora pellucida]|uniref:11108_t:CDS:1 n=1 Tax=Cetraspora pellucida TaxID=1433469 RepID=A0ACA9NWC5_9GLOM|nr:11108_t:CDS:2 [Cetraspora pellucida]
MQVHQLFDKEIKLIQQQIKPVPFATPKELESYSELWDEYKTEIKLITFVHELTRDVSNMYNSSRFNEEKVKNYLINYNDYCDASLLKVRWEIERYKTLCEEYNSIHKEFKNCIDKKKSFI